MAGVGVSSRALCPPLISQSRSFLGKPSLWMFGKHSFITEPPAHTIEIGSRKKY
jgi:hypothetical protein